MSFHINTKIGMSYIAMSLLKIIIFLLKEQVTSGDDSDLFRATEMIALSKYNCIRLQNLQIFNLLKNVTSLDMDNIDNDIDAPFKRCSRQKNNKFLAACFIFMSFLQSLNYGI